MTRKKVSAGTRISLLLSAALLIGSLFVPVWQIDLDAPQYPEGLRLQIWANRIAGDVDIINGLNHYIGMKTLHTDDFMEFKILPYLLGAFAVLFILAALRGRKRGVTVSFFAFVLFGIIAMIDFWKWEYDYGHHLDPNAAIKVPGMAYQPPLIGFKQLLNFGAYSMPTTGGWMLLAAGILLLLAATRENKWLSRLKGTRNRKAMLLFFMISTVLVSCGESGPRPVKLNEEACASCRMTITDARFAAQILTNKGRVYSFDDIHCLQHYLKEQDNKDIKHCYVADYSGGHALTEVSGAWFVQHEDIGSPMGGNVAAFAVKDSAAAFAARTNTAIVSWQQLSNVGRDSAVDFDTDTQEQP